MSKIQRAPRYLLILMLLLTLIGWSSFAWAAETSLTILFTHDLHDHLLPYTTLRPDGQLQTLGGYARLQTAINQYREIDPELLLLDAGDFSMGTLFQTIFATEAPQLILMGQMGYDAITFGNHEFDFRATGLADALSIAKIKNKPLPPITIANVIFPTNHLGKMTSSLVQLKNAMESYPVKEYIILERKGVKIGVFGLMGVDAASNAPMSEVVFTDPIENAKRIVSLLLNEEEVDLIICLSHSGTSGTSPNTEDEILAKQVPEIDIIISGHSHTTLTEPIIVGKTIIGSASEYGENLGVIKIKQIADQSWALQEYYLQTIDESLSEDPIMAELVKDYQQIVQRDYLNHFNLEFDQVVAYSPFNFTPSSEVGEEHAEEPLGNLISDAYIHAVKLAEGDNYEPIAVAISPNGTIRGSFVAGDITVADVFIVSSLGIGSDGIPGYPLISVYLTGKELKTLAEVDASVTPIMKAAQLYIAGLSYTFNPNRLIFNKVTEVYLQNPDGSLEEIDDNKLYRLVGGLYAGQMLPVINDKSFGLLSIVPKNKAGEPVVNFEDQIIRDHNGREVKEWYAIAQYLQSFEPDNGKPIIPDYYSQAQGRKNIEHSKNIFALISKPNKIALAVYSLVILIILLLLLIFAKVAKRIRSISK